MNLFTSHITPFFGKGKSIYLWLVLFQLMVATIFMLVSKEQIIDVDYIGIPPLSNDYLLGTDSLGRSVFNQLIQGAQTTLLLSFIAVLLAGVVGTLLGMISGFLGDDKMKLNTRHTLSILLFVTAFLFFFPFHHFHNSLWYNWMFPFLVAIVIAGLPQLSIKKESTFTLPFDISLNRLVEIYVTLPPIFVIILLTSIFRPSPFLFVLFCMLSMWPEFFLISRAEVLKIKNNAYIESARTIGQLKRKIIFDHLLPNILGPVLVLFSFGFARLMIIEATLSFLGIGLPPEYPGWGKMILAFRENPSYWWLLVFPGFLLFLNIVIVQQLGRRIENSYTSD